MGCPGDSFAEPQFYSSPRNLVFTEKEPATLYCNATANPYSNITWYRDNVRISSGGRYDEKENVTVPSVLHSKSMFCDIRRHPFTQSSLVIEQSRADDTGNYFCEARNVMGVFRYQIKLIIQVYVQFTAVPSSITVVENDNIRLSCRASGVPSPLITWHRKDGRPMPSVFRVILGDLHITGITKQDEGVYECVASNVLGARTTEADITVNVFPVISYFRELPTIINESQTLNIPCHATGFPVPLITWYKTKDSLPNGRYTYNSQRLTISDVRYEDRGEYICTANNTLGTVSKRTWIIVQVPATITSKIRKDAYLSCGDRLPAKPVCSGRGNPSPKIVWKHNGTTIMSRIGGSLTLDLSNVQLHHAGRYTCEATNRFGKANEHFNLNVNSIRRGRVTVQTSCNHQSIDNWSGKITSPNYPRKYKALRRCSWLLTSDCNTTFSLSFKSFKTEKNFDFLKLYDGSSSSSPSLASFSGFSLPPNIASSSNMLFITFNTDIYHAFSGFSMKYQTAP